MRLSLRTLLAYLDDALDPGQVREVSQIVAQDRRIQEVMERIAHSSKRYRSILPEETGLKPLSVHMLTDYLDGTLQADQAREFEKRCLESDHYLAELVACHQLLRSVNEPIQIPPTARTRMYRLTGRWAAGTVTDPLPIEDDESGPLAPEAHPANMPKTSIASPPADYRWLGQVGIAAALLVAISAVLFFAVRTPTSRPPIVNAPTPSEPPPTPTVATLELEKQLNVMPLIAMTSSWSAARPSVANFLMLANTPRDAHAEAKPEIQKPEVEVLKVLPIEVGKPFGPLQQPVSDGQIMAVFNEKELRDNLTLRQVGVNDWRVVRTKDDLRSGERLVALPGYRADLLSAPGGVALELVGGPPEQPAGSHKRLEERSLETSVVLYTSPNRGAAGRDYDFDLALERGQIVVTAPARGSCNVRVRLGQEVWDLCLRKPRTPEELPAKVAVEVISYRQRGNKNKEVMRMTLYKIQGACDLRLDGKGSEIHLSAGQVQAFAHEYHGIDEMQIPERHERLLPEAPAWVVKHALSDDQKSLLQNIERTILARLGKSATAKEQVQMKVTFEEFILNGRPLERRLGTMGYSAIGQFKPIVDALKNQNSETRWIATETLRHALARPTAYESIQKAIQDELPETRKGDVKSVMGLLEGLEGTDRATLERLLTDMASDLALVRHLAHLNLNEVMPELLRTTTTTRYDPLSDLESRTRALRVIRGRLPK